MTDPPLSGAGLAGVGLCMCLIGLGIGHVVALGSVLKEAKTK